MKNLIPIRFMLKIFLVLCILAFGSAPLLAENVFITGWKGTTANSTDYTPDPLSVIDAGFAPAGASGFSASQVNPIPVIPNNSRRIHYGRTEGATWTLTPTDMEVTPVAPAGTGPYTFTALQNFGVYKIYLTKGQSLNASTNIIVEMTATENGTPVTLADSNGVAAAAIPLEMYQRNKANGVWVHVGYITNITLNPTITLRHISGAIDDNAHATLNTGQRWYTDAIWFEFIDSCVGVANQVNPIGPLVQGQTFVNVTGVAAGATNVTIYANSIEIGQTNQAAGFAGGELTVLVSNPLNKDDRIAAGQTKDGCSSLVPSTGPAVGGGANPQIRAFLACAKNPELTGPAGANTTNDVSDIYFLKGDGLVGSSFGGAPTGGEQLFPSQCWQTVTFDHATDLAVTPINTLVQNTDPFCALEGLVFSMDAADSGPYEIYVDQIINGDVIIENFEGYLAGSINTFSAPNLASTPNPGATYLSTPNASMISQKNAFDGTNSLRIQWQWTDTSDLRWSHVSANASTNSGKYYPQLDTTKPITVRYLVLPVGETTNKLSFSTVPVNQAKAAGDNATFTVEAVGDGPLSYQWFFAQQDTPTDVQALPDVGPSLSVNNIDVSKAGFYSVVVTGPECSATLSATLSIGVEAPIITHSLSGSTLTLNWEGTFNLQSKADLNEASWTNVGVSTGPYVTEVTGAATFYRLQAAE